VCTVVSVRYGMTASNDGDVKQVNVPRVAQDVSIRLPAYVI
jgi:hypothetical protein